MWQKLKFLAISITASLIMFSKTYKQSDLFIQNYALSFPADKSCTLTYGHCHPLIIHSLNTVHRYFTLNFLQYVLVHCHAENAVHNMPKVPDSSLCVDGDVSLY
jgi:hypothetical protein